MSSKGRYTVPARVFRVATNPAGKLATSPMTGSSSGADRLPAGHPRPQVAARLGGDALRLREWLRLAGICLAGRRFVRATEPANAESFTVNFRFHSG
jgi:hypothetical protein